MTRKSKPEEHIDNHRWVVSYADFITLLFAFFVVMYAISSVNTSKYKSLAEGMKSAFSDKNQKRITESTDNKFDGPGVKKTKGQNNDGLDELNNSLSDLESDSTKINRQDGWLELNIQAGSLFEPGTADLKAIALIKLMEVATKIKDSPFPVIIEGYTDNLPIETPQYPSNWELSASRAASVARVLNGFGVDQGRILVTGYGEQFPIADNSTEDGRGQNRRVEIIIAKDRSIPRLANPGLNKVHQVNLSHGTPAEKPKKSGYYK